MELEVIEKEVLFRELDLKRASKLFDRYVDEKNYERARKMAWYMYFTHGVDVGIDSGMDIIGWSNNY